MPIGHADFAPQRPRWEGQIWADGADHVEVHGDPPDLQALIQHPINRGRRNRNEN